MAADVEEGLALFRKHQPDIVLIDYHLPRINGIEGVRMLRRLSPTVPILVFTIDENQEVANRFLEAGATDFALKPIKAPDRPCRPDHLPVSAIYGVRVDCRGEQHLWQGRASQTGLSVKITFAVSKGNRLKSL